MSSSDLYLAVHWTARVSALLFAAALAVPVLFREPDGRRRSQPAFLAFLGAHTVHFAFVLALILETGGEKMFPGGRDVADVGGMPAVFGIFAFFYLLAILALLERRRGPRASTPLRLAGRFSTAFVGYMFVSTYIPLVERSPWYALPAALVATAVLLDLFAERFRQLRCFGRASGVVP
jgi:hypothetical protein